MEGIFLKVLNMSLTAAAVIAAVVLLRLPLHRAPKKWRYLLWIAPAFRLCCPVSFRAAFSIFRLRPPAAPASAAAGVGEIAYIPGPAALSPASPVPVIQTPIVSGALSAPQVTAQAAVQAAADPALNWLRIGLVLWLLGIGVMLALGLLRYWKTKRLLEDAAMLEPGVFASDRVGTPFILGLLRPRIYVPASLGGEELGFVLAHERAHLRRGDHWAKLFAYLLLTLHWFNPAVWPAFWLMSRDMEMSCDERVLAGLGGRAKDYSRTLLACASGRRFPAPAPLGFGESDVKSRIKNALHWRRPRLWVTVLAAVLCLAAVAACTANPRSKQTEPETPWAWLTSLSAEDLGTCRFRMEAVQREEVLSPEAVDTLVKLLRDVKEDEVVSGRGIPSEKTLILEGAGCTLRFGGGFVELDFADPAAAAEKYGPAVWEIRNEALYERWIHAAIFDLEPWAADTAADTVAFALADGRLTLESSGREQTYADVLRQVPFSDVSYQSGDNFLHLENRALPAYGVLTPGQSKERTCMAIYGGDFSGQTEDRELPERMTTAPQLTLHTEEEGSDYYVSGVFAGMDFALYLAYAEGEGEALESITLRFLPNGEMDHAMEMFMRLRGTLAARLGSAGLEENLDASKEDMVPGAAIRALWFDGVNVLQLVLEIGEDYDRSLTVRLYAPTDGAAAATEETDGLSKMAALTAKDIAGVVSSGWVGTDAETLAPLMRAAAAHPAAKPEEESGRPDFWRVEVYLTGGPDSFSSLDTRYELCARQTENLVFVRLWDGKPGGAEEYWLDDAPLYALIRGCFRSDGVVEGEAWEKYGPYLEARARETVENYRPYGAGGLVGFDITRLEKTAYFWRGEDGAYLPVYAWQAAFYPEDVNNVGWAGGMKLDADSRVVGIENHTYFAVREGPGGPELFFLPWDGYFRWAADGYDKWREAYRSLFDSVLLKNSEYGGTAEGPVIGVTLADLSGSGMPELIVFLPGASVSGAAAVVTFEDGEARAFNTACSFGLPPAKNAVENGFWANQTVSDDDDAGFRSCSSGWYLNSRNAAWPTEAWCDWLRFGGDRNGFLVCDCLYSLSVRGEESFGGVYTETAWQLNGQTASREEYHAAEVAIEEWRASLDGFRWLELSLSFREGGEPLPPDELTERFDRLLQDWRTDR